MKFLTLGEKLGRPECPYMQRWVINLGLCRICLHHWFYSDDKRCFHDHPASFLTIALSGGYTDVSPAGKDRLSRFSVRFRRANHRHTVNVNLGGAWTFVIFGPIIRRWGFWVKGKFVKSNKYFIKFGHHPCEVK